MSLHSKESFIVRTSTGIYYNIFYKNNAIFSNTYDKNRKILESKELINLDIIDYSVDIDNNDKIHIICITKTGNIIYYIYFKNKLSKKHLTTLDVKSNRYDYFYLKVIKDEIHIFYAFSNIINSTVWTIQHIIGNKQSWEKKNVISITPGKYMSPYYIDFDKLGNIHLIYKNVESRTQQIYYTHYSSFLKSWSKYPIRVSDISVDNLHPYIFVDNRNIIHLVWSKLDNSNLRFVYKQRPVITNQKGKWKSVELPLSRSTYTHPVIYEDFGLLRILYKQNDSIKGLFSKDFGSSWVNDTSLNNFGNQDWKYYRYTSNNHNEKSKIKINHIYAKITDTIELYCKYLNTITLDTKNSTNNDIKISRLNLDTIEQKNKIINKPEKSIAIDTADKSCSVEDNNIEEFVNNTNQQIKDIFSKTYNIDLIKKEIETLLLNNTKNLENKIKSNKNDLDSILTRLDNLNDLVTEYKKENQDISQIIKSINEKYEENLLYIENLESEINDLKNIIKNTPKKNLINKLKEFFK
ncbi:hypothetical protein SAMN02745135_00346 [Caloranaerobacter azorensis DSM 13643]|uniref:BNR repeat-containing family member n=1 Tax=Caloranaerobacter azorensis DSM 13643 TaxID=1121264 RepID=A0A1M5RU20_9FIRM|nr:hypothetical protein [Caloranaerobacter azorensis]SHH29807.1 hypothetical protein SAMN02745135_00346 [Caloranaerobacter azorensis DSM 13643]